MKKIIILVLLSVVVTISFMITVINAEAPQCPYITNYEDCMNNTKCEVIFDKGYDNFLGCIDTEIDRNGPCSNEGEVCEGEGYQVLACCEEFRCFKDEVKDKGLPEIFGICSSKIKIDKVERITITKEVYPKDEYDYRRAYIENDIF